MPEPFGEKTHEATPHRRQQAREGGQVAKSQDLASAALLMSALLILLYLGPSLADFLGSYARRQLGVPPPPGGGVLAWSGSPSSPPWPVGVFGASGRRF